MPTKRQINAAERLAREIMRVAKMRQHYCCTMRGLPNVNAEPAIVMMDQALESACIAAGTSSALEVIESLKKLEKFTD